MTFIAKLNIHKCKSSHLVTPGLSFKENLYIIVNFLNLYHSLGYFNRQQTDDMFCFTLKISFDILCKVSPVETICMKCQMLFSGKIRNIFKMSPVEFYPAC